MSHFFIVLGQNQGKGIGQNGPNSNHGNERKSTSFGNMTTEDPKDY